MLLCFNGQKNLSINGSWTRLATLSPTWQSLLVISTIEGHTESNCSKIVFILWIKAAIFNLSFSSFLYIFLNFTAVYIYIFFFFSWLFSFFFSTKEKKTRTVKERCGWGKEVGKKNVKSWFPIWQEILRFIFYFINLKLR